MIRGSMSTGPGAELRHDTQIALKSLMRQFYETLLRILRPEPRTDS